MNMVFFESRLPDLVETNVGPMIDEASAARVEALIQGAVTQGANLWMGSSRQGAVLAPALLENVAADSEIMREEAFGPVAILESVDSREVALERLNHTRFGLQVGLFTNDLAFVQRAFETLDCGGLIVNDVPTWRSDVMPYGGVKDSGLGREGVKSAIEEYTVRRTLVLKS
jgi:acyl-CoA reductase-like NAD-dependent aldehyde dehydrogenase